MLKRIMTCSPQNRQRTLSVRRQLLAKSLAGRLSDDEQENLGFIIDGAGRMQQMVKSLLLYSSVTTKVVTFEKIDLDKSFY